MARYVAFLRGMNLGGRRIKNDELRAAFEGLGFDDVATFRASGNVIFDAPTASARRTLATKIEAGLADALGYEVPVFLRSGERGGGDRRPRAVRGQARSTPRRASSRSRCCPSEPAQAARKEALALATDEDRLAIEGRELYWLPSGGISESELDLKAIEAALGPWTMRTMGTIEQIAAKHCD